MDEKAPQNQNNHLSENNSKSRDKVSDNENIDTNYFKVKWLTTTLNFIKDNNWHVLVYPVMPQEQMEFIKTLITHGNTSSNTELMPLLASIREAMTIFQLKYDFTLKSTKMKNGAVQLIIKKGIKVQSTGVDKSMNDKCISQNQNKSNEGILAMNSSGGYNSKLIRQKLKIISGVPMKFVLDSLKRIVDFLKDTLSVSIIFEDMNANEWLFLMNLKAFLKERFALKKQLPAQLNELFEEIATLKNNEFTLCLNKDRSHKKKQNRNVTLVKNPKYDKQVAHREIKERTRNRKIKSQEQYWEDQSNSNLGDEGLSALSTSTKDEDFKRPLLEDQQSLSSSMANLTVSISSNTDRRQVTIERGPTTSTSDINYESGEVPDMEEVESTSTAKKKKPNANDRRGSRLGTMKSKLIEAMSVPVESTKGRRMMLLMGWKGGALGARGEGIVEPIMPDLKTVSGVGLGHKQNCHPEKSKKNREKNSGDKSKNGANNCNKRIHIYEADGDPQRTRLEFLQGILELVESFDEAIEFYFHRQPMDHEIDFVQPAIEHFNARTVPELFDNEADEKMAEDVVEAMIGNREVLLHAKISSNNRVIEITKTSDNITFDELIYNDRFVRVNHDLDDSYAEKSTMSDYCEEVTSQLSVERFMSTMEPMAWYGVKTKKQYRLKAFKLMVMGEILDFLEANEVNRIFYIESQIFTNDLKNIRTCIQAVNSRRKSVTFSPLEVSLYERILSKMGNCRLTLDYNENQQLMRVTKVFPRSSSLPENNAIQENVTNNKSSQSEMAASGNVSYNQENQTVLSDVPIQGLIGDNNSSIAEVMEGTNDSAFNKNEDVELDKDEVTLYSNEEFSDKPLSLLADIEKLEKSILARHANFKTKPCGTKANVETKIDEAKERNSLVSYKNVGITCTYPKVEISLKVVKEVQKILSDAIDKCTIDLPLLQYHGVMKNQLVYSCFSEKTYVWIKKVFCDRFVVSDISVDSYDTHRLQMKLNGHNGDIQNVLDKICLYNPDLDLTSWMIGREVVVDNFSLIDIEVNGDSLDYINRNDFSLFAGFDKVQFYMRDF